jgi:hypothetical protein
MSRNFIHKDLERLEIDCKPGEEASAYFSSYRCDCCNGLPGDRYDARAIYWNKKSRIGSSIMRGTFSVCPECIYNWQ